MPDIPQIDPNELANLFAGISRTPITVGILEPQLAQNIKATCHEIWLSYDTAIKQQIEHDEIELRQYLTLPDIFARGLALQDTTRSLTFLYQKSITPGGLLRATVKATKLGDEIYLATFHMTNAKKILKFYRRADLRRYHS